jgi:hypothetical protein
VNFGGHSHSRCQIQISKNGLPFPRLLLRIPSLCPSAALSEIPNATEEVARDRGDTWVCNGQGDLHTCHSIGAALPLPGGGLPMPGDVSVVSRRWVPAPDPPTPSSTHFSVLQFQNPRKLLPGGGNGRLRSSRITCFGLK